MKRGEDIYIQGHIHVYTIPLSLTFIHAHTDTHTLSLSLTHTRQTKDVRRQAADELVLVLADHVNAVDIKVLVWVHRHQNAALWRG